MSLMGVNMNIKDWDRSLPDIAQIEKLCKLPVQEWKGKCYEIACFVARVLDGATPVYGHFLGSVDPESLFYSASLCGFVQHGWVLLKTDYVFDPTRWVFEACDPYLYYGMGVRDYDEGGNSLRMHLLGPPPLFDPEEEVVINVTSRLLGGDAWNFVENLLELERSYGDEEYEIGDVTSRQLHWLANFDPRMMQGHATEVFRFLNLINMSAHIPLDNQLLVERAKI